MKPTQRASSGASARFFLTGIAGIAEGKRTTIPEGGIQVGRSRGALLFAADPFVSDLHATLWVREGRLWIRDERSASGVFASVQVEPLVPSTLFCAGRHLFRFAGPVQRAPSPPNRPVPYGAPFPPGAALFRVEEVLVGGRTGAAFVAGAGTLRIGRGPCDWRFPEDPDMAERHVEISLGPSGAGLRDVSDGLGTFVRIAHERPLAPGDRVRIGAQVLQVSAAG